MRLLLLSNWPIRISMCLNQNKNAKFVYYSQNHSLVNWEMKFLNFCWSPQEWHGLISMTYLREEGQIKRFFSKSPIKIPMCLQEGFCPNEHNIAFLRYLIYTYVRHRISFVWSIEWLCVCVWVCVYVCCVCLC